jgi:THO complex subunit 1
MQPSKGKSLTLLKLLNHLLNQTSHIMVNFEDSTNILLFRARIHLFITEWFKLNDMSGVNLRGEYSEMRSAWPNIEEDEEEEHEEDQEKEDLGSDTKETTEKQSKPADDGKQIENVETTENEQKETSGEEPTQEADVQATPDKMQVDLPEEKPAAEPEKPEEPKGEDLYTSLYHVQTVFVHPPSLVVAPSKTPAQEGESSETPIQAFRRRSDLILAELKYRRNEALAMIKEIKEAILAGEDDAELRSEEYPVFLTSRSTLKADVSSRSCLFRHLLAEPMDSLLSLARQPCIPETSIRSILYNVQPTSSVDR